MNALRHLTVPGRLALAFGLLLVVLTAQSALGFLSASRSAKLVDHDVPAQRNAVEAGLLAQAAAFRVEALWRELSAQADPQGRKATVQALGQAARDLDQDVARVGAPAALASLAAQVSAAQQALLKQAQADAAPEDTRAAFEQILAGPLRQLGAALKTHAATQDASLGSTLQVVSQLANGALVAIVVSALVSIVAATLAGWLLHRSITPSLKHAVQVADRVAAGDLTVQIESDTRNEVGDMLRALSRMAEKMRGALTTVVKSSETIMTASSEIAAGNADLSQRTELQASSVQVAASSVQQMADGVRDNAEAARQANVLASESAMLAAHGGERVAGIVTTMQDISRSSQQMAQIVGVIDGIAFQTNILALNAAVEAARAGDQGRGFAVVAAEVRTLAQRSAASAKEIKGLISANMAMVQAGVGQVGDTGDSIRKVVQASEKVSGVVARITESTHEQARSIDQINQAIGRLDQGVQQNAALVEQSAAAAGSLKTQTVSLNVAMQRFRLTA